MVGDVFSPEEKEMRKRAIYDQMSAKRRKRVDRIGYENWDPFIAPNDPIEIRRDRTGRTAQRLLSDFYHDTAKEEKSQAYSQGILEMAMGMVNNDERYLAMYEFSQWYREELNKQGR